MFIQVRTNWGKFLPNCLKVQLCSSIHYIFYLFLQRECANCTLRVHWQIILSIETDVQPLRSVWTEVDVSDRGCISKRWICKGKIETWMGMGIKLHHCIIHTHTSWLLIEFPLSLLTNRTAISSQILFFVTWKCYLYSVFIFC